VRESVRTAAKRLTRMHHQHSGECHDLELTRSFVGNETKNGPSIYTKSGDVVGQKSRPDRKLHCSDRHCKVQVQ